MLSRGQKKLTHVGTERNNQGVQCHGIDFRNSSAGNFKTARSSAIYGVHSTFLHFSESERLVYGWNPTLSPPVFLYLSLMAGHTPLEPPFKYELAAAQATNLPRVLTLYSILSS